MSHLLINTISYSQTSIQDLRHQIQSQGCVTPSYQSQGYSHNKTTLEQHIKEKNTMMLDGRIKNPELDKPMNTKQEMIVSLCIQTMVYKYLGVKDNTSEGGWKFPSLDLSGYNSEKPRFFDDERVGILLHGWKNYVHQKYDKEMNSLGMSAIMQNQLRKAFKNNELNPLFNPLNKYHAKVLENKVCKTLECLLEFAETNEVRSKVAEVLYA